MASCLYPRRPGRITTMAHKPADTPAVSQEILDAVQAPGLGERSHHVGEIRARFSNTEHTGLLTGVSVT